ncbi:alpha/beta hydrolase [Streptomyces sp. H10-C2]|uniref:alpha/beta hydrolase family protein n=1 Tax=unclassified Streptomyces TaxID=2593676 RepID=UPI0024B8C3E2|nr:MULTISPECIES: alpha/beta hydrolase [unclassified Streptomyces]MDJ0344466.1 alpha/beta hydrolase [Streptomyces sp. PH10-H1]MDJ0372058.1 alpha/beta hydrolase [Streptomyces sp. H10-C2]
MTRIRGTAIAAVLALVLPLPIAAADTAFAAPGPAPDATATSHAFVPAELPRPTGPHAVGRSTLHLVDQQRQDPWVPSAGPRQLMVSMYYPARPGTGGPAAYMTTEEARLLLQDRAPGSNIPPEELSGTRTWAHADARPARGRFPLVVLSPGFTFPRGMLTSLAEDLASRGYVVALADHTYEAPGITFPNGQTLTCAICERPPTGGFEAIARSRAKDLFFVIDQLTQRHPAWRYAHTIDPERSGAAGHSISGDATAMAMAADDRVRAGVDMDGSFQEANPAAGLHGRPFLLFGAEHEAPGMDASWRRGWANLNGWKRWLTITGSDHGTFTDLNVLSAQADRPVPSGAIPPVRGLEITRAYLGAFFDLQLKGIAQPLLDGPSPANPEVVFQQP